MFKCLISFYKAEIERSAGRNGKIIIIVIEKVGIGKCL